MKIADGFLKRQGHSARYLRIVWRLSLVVILLLLLFPVGSRMLNLLLVLTLAGAWLSGLLLSWNYKPLRFAHLGLAALLLLLTLPPGRAADPDRLRRQYIHFLQTYEGANYVWGGEGSLGIDCSGLMRCAWMRANLQTGILTLNPSLVREGLSLWWRDSSARNLGEGYGGRTELVRTAEDINSLDTSLLLPGDMGVVAGGSHVMAYLGGGTWIEADPTVMKVIRLRAPDKVNPWLNSGVRVMRWRSLMPGVMPSQGRTQAYQAAASSRSGRTL